MSISSPAENDFVMKNIVTGLDSQFWLGGKATLEIGELQWSDGTSWSLGTLEQLAPPVQTVPPVLDGAPGILNKYSKLNNTVITSEEKEKLIQVLLKSDRKEKNNTKQVVFPLILQEKLFSLNTDLCVKGRTSGVAIAGNCEEKLPFVCEY